LSDDLPSDLRPVAGFFGLPGTASVTKDFYVVRAITAVAAIDAELRAGLITLASWMQELVSKPLRDPQALL
jgi:hypothetical protein